MSNNGHKKLLQFTQAPQRVVSLVPSLTESLFDLGLAGALVGITDYCTQPAEGVKNITHVGGPKTPKTDDILALQPDLVLANMEENPLQAVETLEAQGVAVWVTLPKTVRQALDVLWKIVELFRSNDAAIRLQTLEVTLDWAESALSAQPPFRYFCPIWQDALGETAWWMTFNRDTYMHDLLRLMGGVNVFADRQRRYPIEADLDLAEPEPSGERDTRYPRLTLAAVRAAQPEVVLLPDEPFAFSESHQQALGALLADTPAGQAGKLVRFEGSLLTWHGTRLAKALRELPALLG